MEEIVAGLGFQEMVTAAERRRVGEVLEIHGRRRSWRGEKEEGAGGWGRKKQATLSVWRRP